MHVVGQHCLLDAYGVDEAWSKNAAEIEDLLRQAANIADATVINSHFHVFGEGGGVTGVLLLAESHMSIHTWPEHAYVAIDIFMCGQHRIDAALQFLKLHLPASRTQTQMMDRGRYLTVAQAVAGGKE